MPTLHGLRNRQPSCSPSVAHVLSCPLCLSLACFLPLLLSLIQSDMLLPSPFLPPSPVLFPSLHLLNLSNCSPASQCGVKGTQVNMISGRGQLVSGALQIQGDKGCPRRDPASVVMLTKRVSHCRQSSTLIKFLMCLRAIARAVLGSVQSLVWA